MRGGEWVLDAMAEVFPKAELFTLIAVAGKSTPLITQLKRHTSWLQSVPGIAKRYRHFLPWMPLATRSWKAQEFDLILSSSHCVAKGIRKGPNAVHVSYVHAPMRYMWERFDDYFGPGRASGLVRMAARVVRPFLRAWDRRTSTVQRVNHIVANSRFIADQVERCYARSAAVVHPFVRLERFGAPRNPGKNYLMVGAFAPYKRVDLAIEAFNRLKLPLIIVGGGQDEERLKKLAGPTVEFLGPLSDKAVADLYARCRALVFPGIEDFGITPLEALAAGMPVVALNQGGATETVTDQTGFFFSEQTVDSLVAAIQACEAADLKAMESACRGRAAEFTRKKFQEQWIAEIRGAWLAAGKSLETLEMLLAQSWVNRP